MSEHDRKRREFLGILMSLPMGFVLGCRTELPGSSTIAPLLSPKESLRKLILLVGPWSDQDQADNFARRFLQTKQAAGRYLSGSSELLQRLASRFPNGTMAVDKIDLQALPEPERELLTNLVQQIHCFLEVRFRISDEPPFGECQEDRLRHTRVPGSGEANW